ncbi:MAG: energy transducer TonB [Gammaproteobacteria bacterium]|nr:energy transducer TonB [Gammaproteobacteria bacterium]
MTAARAPSPQVQAGDRLAMTLFLAAAVHAMVILGVSFEHEPDRPADIPPTLDVTLVQSASDEAPEEADYLAQADQQGGGEAEEKAKPQAPVSGPEPEPNRGAAPAEARAAAPRPRPAKSPQRLTAAEAKTRAPSEPKPVPEQRRVSAEELVSRSMRIASLTAALEAQRREYALRPRHTYVSARTRKHVLAAYMEAWVDKVERIGNLNYPEAARRQGLSGNLMLDVALEPDGSVNSIRVRRSSGTKVLDDAAVRIVRLAGPFAPFPAEVREKTDILHIIRTWRFLSSNRLQAD